MDWIREIASDTLSQKHCILLAPFQNNASFVVRTLLWNEISKVETVGWVTQALYCILKNNSLY